MAYVSVVVPLCNEEAVVSELLARLAAAVGAVTVDYELVLVDDGSSDRTWALVQTAGKDDRRIRGIRLSRNFGQHYAITAGLDACDGDWVVVMDGDLQDRPEDIPRLLRKAEDGFDVVLARRQRRKHHFVKKVSSWFFWRLFSYLTDTNYDEHVGNFRVMSRRVVAVVKTMREQLRFLGGLVDWLGFPQASIDVEHAGRHAGTGRYSVARLWRLAQDIVIAYSDKPLRLAVRFGFVISGLAFAYGVYVVVRALVMRVPVPGWSSLIASLYFLAGVTFVILGVVGIYLGRTFAEVKRRPLYAVRERCNL